MARIQTRKGKNRTTFTATVHRYTHLLNDPKSKAVDRINSLGLE
jgi:hypothetical protein